MSICLLLALAALGTGAYALVAGSAVAGMFAAGLVLLLAATAIGFRMVPPILAQSTRNSAKTPRREQVGSSKAMYREIRENHEQLLQAVAVPVGAPTTLMARRRA